MYQQDKKRIYERKVALDSHAVHHFWNERAKKYNDNTPYSTVKLSDKNYDYAQQLDLVEKEKFCPYCILMTETTYWISAVVLGG